MASNIFRGYEFLISPRVDFYFAIGIGIAAATVRIRREETCHRLGSVLHLPSNSMISLIEQERHKFDDHPNSRSNLSMQSWSLGDSREADYLRQDAMRSKFRLQKAQEEAARQRGTTVPAASASTATAEPAFTSIPRGPELSRDSKTGELVLGPTPPSPYDDDDDDVQSKEDSIMSKEEERLQDAAFKKRFRDAQPSPAELAAMFGGRAVWFVQKCWFDFWERPWFFRYWTTGWDYWKTGSSASSESRRRWEKNE